MSDAQLPSAAWSRGRRAALALVLVAAVAWAFAPAMSAQFVYDDRLVVLQNPAVAHFDLAGLLAQPLWAFHGPEPDRAVGYWRPLASALLALIHAIAGPEARAFHVASIALHAAASLAAWALARRITRSDALGFAVALVFAVHPVHVESAAWISAIGDPAFGLCVLLALERHLAWRESGSRGVPWSAVLLFAAGLAAKELAAGFLVCVVALDLALGRRERGVRAWIPYALTFGAYVVARMLVFQSAFAGFDRVTTDFGVGLGRLLLLRAEILGLALRYAFVPIGQRVFHPFAPDAAAAALGVPLLLLGTWTVLAVWLARRGERTLLAALLLVLAPLAVIVVRVGALGTFPFSERYLYLSVFGAALFGATLVHRFVPLRVAAAILVGAAGLFTDATRRRTRVWHDEETLFRAAAVESPRSPYARWLRGRERLEAYRNTRDLAALRDAETEFVAALDLLLAARDDGSIFAVVDDHVQANVGRGWVLLYAGEADGSRDFQPPATLFRLVTERYPASAEAWTGLGVAQMELGDLLGAEEALKKAIAIDPGFVAAHRNLGRLRVRREDWLGARAAFEDALRREPESVETLVLLGTALERSGDDAGARNAFDRASRLAPRDPRPRVQRVILDAKAGKLDAALAELDAVLDDAPEDGEAHLVRGKVLLARGEKQRALLALRRACDLLPSSYEAHYNAGALALELEGPASALPHLVRAYENRPRTESGKALADVIRAGGVAGPGAYVQLATADADRGERDAALAWIDLALARDANHGPAYFLRGGMLAEKGDREGARAAWTRAVELLPESFPAREALAGVLLELGDRAGALREYREALRILERAGADPGQVEVVRTRVLDLASDGDAR